MSDIADRLLEKMQNDLGPLDEDAQRIKGQIDALEVCDLGFPLTVEEILSGIGQGELAEPAFRPGCTVGGSGWTMRGTQPRHVESMAIIRDVVADHVQGTPTEELLNRFSCAANFIDRTVDWLGPPEELTDLQRLLIERMLLAFEWWATEDTHAMCHLWTDEAESRVKAIFKDLTSDDGRGATIDAKIQAEIDQLADATDETKQQWRKVHGFIARGDYGFCDCHHDVFRNIENWIYGIGTGNWGIPSRKPKTERKRLERALLAYAIATDRWLAGVPMALALLDLGHVDLGFDPRNAILRTYAYLGDERTPTTEWLVACLWNWLHAESQRREETLRAAELGVSARAWLDSLTGNTDRP